jgi:taspase (threonine aspartase 1)
MFGSGCWAERSAGGRSVACSVSGQGELIVQSLLAKSLAERAAASTEGDTHEILRSVLVDQFYGASPYCPRNVGV